jgi:D-alanyl-D-alanine carboxypeptidase/D-alanyl-D-alanine-endopeptidase (penicillin-binding protein 4)
LKPARWIIVSFVALVLLTGLVAPAIAAATSVSLAAAKAVVVFGDDVVVSGSVTGDTGCIAGREVDLEWRAADSSTFAALGHSTTAADGSFSFDASQPNTGRYRATLGQQTGCEAAVSAEVLVRVRALIDSFALAGRLTAGSCVEVGATVAPAKPGQLVEIQRRTDGGWATIDTAAFDDQSHATSKPCFGWSDIGVVRVRARWTAQDPLNETNKGITLAFQITEAPWMSKIDDVIGARSVSVAVGESGATLYERAEATPRTPASNEKLLLSMTLLDTFVPTSVITTEAASKREPVHGTLSGDLWILGRGDPEVDRRTMGTLARGIVAAGIEKIDGRVIGSTRYFLRDWDAPGWNSVARQYVARPTALTFEGNSSSAPERAAAAALVRQLERRGVKVTGEPGSGEPPSGLADVASVRSRPLQGILVNLLRPSNNFYAEVLGKGLGAEVSGAPGTIAKGAAAIQAWVRDHGADFTLYDNSGLSYANRVTAAGIVHLLDQAEDESWGTDLRRALPTGGQGTLRDRLHHAKVRAKTGTLTSISALSGWIWSDRLDTWIEFSILSSGMAKTTASGVEDRIVKILQASAR